MVDSGLTAQGSDNSYDRFRNRLKFPIRGEDGKLRGFAGRILPSEQNYSSKFKPKKPPAKYINSPASIVFNKKQTLYGFNHIVDTVRNTKKIVFVEGYFDVISLHNMGIENAVATMGTSVSFSQIQVAAAVANLQKGENFTVFLLMDNDSAGQSAADRVVGKLKRQFPKSENVMDKKQQKGAMSPKATTIVVKIAALTDVINFIQTKVLPFYEKDSLREPEFPLPNNEQVDQIKDSSDLYQLFPNYIAQYSIATALQKAKVVLELTTKS